MRTIVSTFALIAAAFVAPVLAHAATVDVFTITATTGPAFSETFTLPSSPTPPFLPSSSATEFDINGTSTVTGTPPSGSPNGPGTSPDTFQFYTTAGGGGFCTDDLCSDYNGMVQLFTGSVTSPTFIPVTNLAFTDTTGSGVHGYTLTINSVTLTPEPSSLILLGTGVFGLAGAARRRFLK